MVAFGPGRTSTMHSSAPSTIVESPSCSSTLGTHHRPSSLFVAPSRVSKIRLTMLWEPINLMRIYSDIYVDYIGLYLLNHAARLSTRS